MESVHKIAVQSVNVPVTFPLHLKQMSLHSHSSILNHLGTSHLGRFYVSVLCALEAFCLLFCRESTVYSTYQEMPLRGYKQHNFTLLPSL